MHDTGVVCKHAHAAIESLRTLTGPNPPDGSTVNEQMLARAILLMMEDIYYHLIELAPDEPFTHR